MQVRRMSDDLSGGYKVVDSMVLTATAPTPDANNANGGSEPKLPMMLLFGEHARELISACAPTPLTQSQTPPSARPSPGPLT